jgi:hypothetical protein
MNTIFSSSEPKNDPEWNPAEVRSHALEGVTLGRKSVTAPSRERSSKPPIPNACRTGDPQW